MFVADCVRLSSFAFCGGLSNSNVVSKTAGTKTEFDIKQPFKVINFGRGLTNRKRVCDFLLVRHSNFGPILHHFRDIAGFLCS